MISHLGGMRVRLFLALPPGNAKGDIQRARDALKACVSGRFVRDDQLHLTLLFLGEVEPSLIPAIQNAMDDVAAMQPPVSLRLAGYQAFRNILVLRVDGELTPLHASLKAAILPLGIPLESRPFKAHITLARDARRPELWPLCPEVQWTEDTVTLYHSVFQNRLEYIPLHSVKLHGGSA